MTSPHLSRGRSAARLAGVAAVLLAVLASIVGPAAPARAAGTVTLGAATYSESFDSLVSTSTGTLDANTPPGWGFLESGTNANTTYTAGTGSANTGDTYSFGATGASERAFGGLQSGSLTPTIGASFSNGAGGTITALAVSYTGEQWRLGALSRVDRLDFQYSLDATSLNTGTWISVDALDFVAPVTAGTAGALDGNAPANRTAITGSITGLSIPAGANFWLRWSSFDATSADDGLAVDDFSLSATLAGPADPVINEFSASTAGTDVEYVEIFGTPSTSYSGYTLLEIEGDFATTTTGVVDEVIPVDSTGANGLWLGSLPANALENGSLTLLLVEGFTGAAGNDLDTNDDGTLDVTPWARIVDAVAVNDGGAGDLTYGAPALGVSFDGAAFAPGGASRIPDGADTDAATDWVRNDFDLAGIPGTTGTPVVGEALNTPGAPNQAVTADGNSVTVEAVDGDAGEDAGATGAFRITRSGSTADALAVSYTLSGTASSADYTPALGGTVEIPAGVSSVDLVITPVDDADIEGPETLTLTLVAGSGYLLGAATSASITIVDNDAGVVITRISAIQGSGDTAAAGTFTVEAIVVSDYQTQGGGQLRGFFIQEEDADADADPATSEGIFVFCTTCPTPVAVGDRVQVTGATTEFFGMSQLSASTAGSVSVISSGNPLPTPASLELPVPGVPSGDLAAATAAINAYFERSEGMLVSFPDTLAVAEYFELARYGQVILSEGGRPRTFTDANTPSAAGLIDHEIDLARRSVILDDTDNRQNRPTDTPNTAYYHPVPGLSTGNFFRGGDTITGLTGVLHWSFAGQSGTDAWRIRPVTEAFSYGFTSANPRPAAPELGGSLQVASFNVLNYFLSIDTANTCAPTQNQDCRGADSAQELERQRTKLLAALQGLDADVLGLIEMENTPGVEPLADIVAGLPGYSYVDTGVIGTDAIRVGIIYKTASVTPVGGYAILDSSVDPRFVDTRNRPALAQTFEESATGARFTVVVNHLKSKGSDCGPGDDDLTTGQGNCNFTRTQAALALADWLAGDPTDSGDPDVLIIGDLNSYAKEDPIVALESAGYTNLVAAFGGPEAYSYVFDGQLGYLDHALANASLAAQVAGVAEWHINADEIPLFDYNDEERTADEQAFEEESDVLPLYEPNEFRTSDHDPVIVGLSLTVPNSAPVAADDSYATAEDTALTVAAPGVLANDSDPDGDTLTITIASVPANGTLALGADGGFTYTPNANFNGVDGFTYTLSDGAATSNTATVTISVAPANDLPTITALPNQATAEDSPIGPLAFSIGDIETAAGDLIVTASSSNQALVPNANIALGGSGAGRTVTITPAANASGSATVTLTVSDGTESASTSFQLTVVAVNDAPVAVDDSSTVRRNGVVVIRVLQNDSDIDGGVLRVRSVTAPSNGTVVNLLGSVIYTPRRGFVGTDTFTYTVSDGRGGKSTATVTVTVTR